MRRIIIATVAMVMFFGSAFADGIKQSVQVIGVDGINNPAHP
jgi:hypothetical protein